jgi:hypothetical protein
MIKNYFTICALAAAMGLNAQADVTLTVNDQNNKNKTGIKFKGQFNSWAEVAAYDDGTNGDATANDNIWSLKIASVPDGTYEWGCVDQSGTWLLTGSNYKFTVNSGAVTGQTEHVIPKLKPTHPVTFTISDLAKKETKVSLKGSMFGWNAKPMFDDGTNGDATAGDNIWSLKENIEEGSWEWGIENQCGWKLVGPNRKYTVNTDGTTTGDISYSIPALSTPINVTFRVWMGDVIVNSAGLYVAGDFQDAISGKSLCNWSKDTLRLSDANKDDVYELKVSVSPGSYQYKYFNGRGGDLDGEKGDFKTGGCGNDNGLGGFNRTINLSGLTKDTVLVIHKYDSCATYKAVMSSVKKNTKVVSAMYPNPASSNANILFADKTASHSVEVMDLAGKVVAVYNFTEGTASGSISKPAKGMFLVRVTSSNGQYSSDLIIFE